MESSGFGLGSAYPCSVLLSHVIVICVNGGDSDGSGHKGVWLVSVLAGAAACLSCGLPSASGYGIGSTGYLVSTTSLSFDFETAPTGLRLQLELDLNITVFLTSSI
eukprot:SAG31_NODE_5905_length_2264_cov_1.627252_4_plen_106_part_00